MASERPLARVYHFDFALWWATLRRIAQQEKFELDVRNPKSYSDYFEDGDSPRAALNAELKAYYRG